MDRVVPRGTLVLLVLAVNVVGDWLRDRFNPKLRGPLTMPRARPARSSGHPRDYASNILLADGPAFIAVDDVDLSIMPGEIHALVGESGAGKTTIGNGVDGPAAGARTNRRRDPSR